MIGSGHFEKGDFGNIPPLRQGNPALRSAGAHTDVLFVGAHPDDEFWNLSTFGHWKEDHEVTMAIVTITRGEGGGNAVGMEEGAGRAHLGRAR
jgi:Uncharacterized proteins, LmbE homologs